MNDRNLPKLDTAAARRRYRNKYELAPTGVRVCEGACGKLKALDSQNFYATSGGTFEYACSACRRAKRRKHYDATADKRQRLSRVLAQVGAATSAPEGRRL